MVLKGYIQNGEVVLNAPLDLPDGTVVELLPVSLPQGRHHPDVERFADVVRNASEDGRADHLKYLEKRHQ